MSARCKFQKLSFQGCKRLKIFTVQAPVVQRADIFIYWINLDSEASTLCTTGATLICLPVDFSLNNCFYVTKISNLEITLMLLKTITTNFLAAYPDIFFSRKSSLVSCTLIFQFPYGFGCSQTC